MLIGSFAIIIQLIVIYFIIKLSIKITIFFIKLFFYILAISLALNVLHILAGLFLLL